MITNDKEVNINGVLLLSKDDMVVRAANEYGQFEPESFEYWEEYTKDGGIAVDVGSYTGVYAIMAAKSGCDSYAFEPNDLVFSRLKENVSLNSCDVNMFNVALSNSPGVMGFKRKNIPFTSAGSVTNSNVGYQCVVSTLDSYFNKTCRVCAIKIDVEGHEYLVLKGASQVIQRNKPLVIAEFLNDVDRNKVRSLMIEYGYDEPVVADKRNLVFIP